MFRRSIAPLCTITLLVVIAQVLMWAGRPSIAALRSGTATFDEALGGVAAIAAWVLLGWVVLVLLATALAAVPGIVGRAAGRLAGAITPAAARRTARLALGVAVAGGPVALSAVPAAAHLPGEMANHPVGALPADDAADLPLIERPTRPGQSPQPAEPLRVANTSGGASVPAPPEPVTDRPAEPEPPEPPPTSVAVQEGDSLWKIAARHLGPDATDAQIAAAWPRWYMANRDVIGDDPNLIVPGTSLTPPDAS